MFAEEQGAALNWVERKKRAEEHLVRGASYLWRDLCNALTDASHSFNQLYQAKTEAKPISADRFRVTYTARNGAQQLINIDFNEQDLSVDVSYRHSSRGGQRYSLSADESSAFFSDSHGHALTADAVSELILKPAFSFEGMTTPRGRAKARVRAASGNG